jgi:hypothetical protein
MESTDVLVREDRKIINCWKPWSAATASPWLQCRCLDKAGKLVAMLKIKNRFQTFSTNSIPSQRCWTHIIWRHTRNNLNNRRDDEQGIKASYKILAKQVKNPSKIKFYHMCIRKLQGKEFCLIESAE